MAKIARITRRLYCCMVGARTRDCARGGQTYLDIASLLELAGEQALYLGELQEVREAREKRLAARLSPHTWRAC